MVTQQELLRRTRQQQELQRARQEREVSRQLEFEEKQRQQLLEQQKIQEEEIAKQRAEYEAAKKQYDKQLIAMETVKKLADELTWTGGYGSSVKIAREAYTEAGLDPDAAEEYMKSRKVTAVPSAPVSPSGRYINIKTGAPVSAERPPGGDFVPLEDVSYPTYSSELPDIFKPEYTGEQQRELTEMLPPSQVRELPTKEEVRASLTVEPAPPPPKWDWARLDPFPRAHYELSKIERETEFKPLKTGAGFVAAGVSMLSVFRHPIETVKGTSQLIYSKEAREDVKEQIVSTVKYREEYALGFGLGLALTPKLARKVTPQLPPVKAKVGDWLRTIGKKEVPPEIVVPKQVLTGKKTFPTAPPERHLKIFKEGKYELPGYEKGGAYHAYPEPWKTLEVAKGESYLPGAYVAPGVSAYFLKVKPTKYKPTMTEIFYPEYVSSKPGAMYIVPKGFRERAVKKIGKKYKWAEKGKPGYAEVPKVKTEIEAIIAPGTQLKKVAGKYYFKYEGRRIPIYEYKVITDKGVKISKESVLTFGEETKKYYVPTSKGQPPTRSYSIISYKPSSKLTSIKYSPTYKPTYKPSYKLSYKTPIIVSSVKYTPYQPSYKVTTPYAPSYKGVSYAAPSMKYTYYPTYPPYRTTIPPVTKVSYRRPIKKYPKRPAPVEKKGYYPEAKEKISRKWRRLSKKPMSKQDALDRMSYAIDHSVSATGRVVKAKKLPKRLATAGTEQGHFRRTIEKYREYLIKRGKKVKTPDKYIEKRRARIDTKGEKKDLKLAQLIKQKGWRKTIKKKRKRRTKWF